MYGPDEIDPIERLIALETAIQEDPRLSPAQREYLLRELDRRLENGEFDGLDDGDLAAWVRNVSPRPKDRSGGSAAEEPEQ